MHPGHLPLLDVVRVGIGQPEQPLGKMPHHRVPMQKFLIVEPLGKHFFTGGGTDQGALVGKDQFFGANPLPRFLQDPRFTHPRQIEQQHPRVDIIGTDQIFAVMIPRRRVFHLRNVGIVQQAHVPLKQDIHVQIQ